MGSARGSNGVAWLIQDGAAFGECRNHQPVPGAEYFVVEMRPDALMISAFAKGDRKSTRLNSSHSQISYAVFCLKKKKKKTYPRSTHVNSTHSQNLYRLVPLTQHSQTQATNQTIT